MYTLTLYREPGYNRMVTGIILLDHPLEVHRLFQQENLPMTFEYQPGFLVTWLTLT